MNEYSSIFIASSSMYIATTFLIIFLFLKKKSIYLLLWPYLIYGIGPVLTGFLDIPSLAIYIKFENIFYQTFIISVTVLTIILLDFFLDLSHNIDYLLFNNQTWNIIARKKVFHFFVCIFFAIVCIFQINF